MSALENYRSEYGEFPSPKVAQVPVAINGHSYNAAGSLMLYQAISGDGDDNILTAKGHQAPSDGKLSDVEFKNIFMKDIPREMILKTNAGYIFIDGFGHPFQYTIPGPDSINSNYDLWSFGEAVPPTKIDKAAKQNPAVSNKWIKNWE